MAAAPAADAILGNLATPTIFLEADHSVSESAGTDEVCVGARIMLLEKLDEIFALTNIDHLRGERFVDVEILFLRRIKPTAFVIAHQGKVGAGDLRPIGRMTLGRETTRYQKCAHESRAVKHDKCAVHGFFSVIHVEMASGQRGKPTDPPADCSLSSGCGSTHGACRARCQETPRLRRH